MEHGSNRIKQRSKEPVQRARVMPADQGARAEPAEHGARVEPQNTMAGMETTTVGLAVLRQEP